jgi:hypothetical protein
MSQKLAVTHFTQTSLGLTTNDGLGTGSQGNVIMIDLGATKICSGLKYRATGSATSGGWGYGYSNGLSVDYWSGSAWVSVVTISGLTQDFAVFEPSFTGVSARYWRLSRASGGWTSATRFQMQCAP